VKNASSTAIKSSFITAVFIITVNASFDYPAKENPAVMRGLSS
jgi:hypothetical protein